MNALSLLLKRVAKRVIASNPTPETLLETADRITAWVEAEYIGESEVGEIAAVMDDVDAPASQPAADEGAGIDVGEPEHPDLSTMTKAELLDYAEYIGLSLPSSDTKAQIIEAIQEHEG